MAAASPTLSLICLGLALVGLLGAYLGIVSPMAGFQTFVAGALLGGLFSTALALIGVFLTRGGRDPVVTARDLPGAAAVPAADQPTVPRADEKPEAASTARP